MKSKLNELRDRLAKGEYVLLDGAMGTEILNRGVSTALPLWSADALLKKPEVVQEIHEDYIKVGAEIIITNTFNSTRRMFEKKGIGPKAREATILACNLALQARDAVKVPHKVYIAGSVAPLEDCYSPELTPSEKELQAEHLELAKDLKDGGVDFILIETMITLRETVAAFEAAKKVGLPAAVSFCTNDKLELLGGEYIDDVVRAIEKYEPLFIGVNCVSHQIATKTVKRLHKITKRPIAAYAQGDGIPDDDQGWKFTHKDLEKAYLSSAKQWAADGAQVIGGCCGTTPEFIKKLQTALQ